jgi:hypothetical protein
MVSNIQSEVLNLNNGNKQCGKLICEICGKSFNKSPYGKPYENICSSECFDKKFW